MASYEILYGGNTYEFGPVHYRYYNITYGGNTYSGWYGGLSLTTNAYYIVDVVNTYLGGNLPAATLNANRHEFAEHFGSYYY